MPYFSIPENSILEAYEYLGMRNGQRMWRSASKKRCYTWDGLHGEVEVFNKQGYHLGTMDPLTGEWIKDAIKGRRCDVS